MPFAIPSDLTVLDDAALEAALAEALAEADALDAIAVADMSAEQAERTVALAEFVTAAYAHMDTQPRFDADAVEMARQQIKARRGDLAAEDETAQAEDGESPPATEVEVVEMPDAGEVENPVESKPAQTPAEADAPADSNLPAPAEEQPQSDPEADVPDQKPSAVTRAAGSAPAQQEAAHRYPVALTAAADVPGIPSGKVLDTVADIARAVEARFSAYPVSYPGRDVHLRNGAAVLTVQRPIMQQDFRDDDEMFRAAANEARLPGGSLVAAGGWDAPSETLYDLCGGEVVTGLVRLPEVGVSRGGVRYTKGPTLADVMASGTGFWDMTEAQVEVPTAKTALRPTTPTFVEQRLDAVGTYVQAGLLTRQGYPELVRRYIELATKAHAYKVNTKVITALETQIGAANSITDGFGNALDLLHALELLIEGERRRLKLSENASMEVLLPTWVKAVLRADITNRTGNSDPDLADAKINAAFRTRGAAVQYLYAWQDLTYATGYPVGYPDTVTAIVYPAGTYVKGTSPVIQLDTIYDSVLLEENHYIALFLEEGILVANPCGEGKRITVPFRANGRTGAADLTNNIFNAGI